VLSLMLSGNAALGQDQVTAEKKFTDSTHIVKLKAPHMLKGLTLQLTEQVCPLANCGCLRSY
jgi:hypothetical protein